jgi:hypothetical protein
MKETWKKSNTLLKTRPQVPGLIKLIIFKVAHDKLQVNTIVEIAVFEEYYTW